MLKLNNKFFKTVDMFNWVDIGKYIIAIIRSLYDKPMIFHFRRQVTIYEYPHWCFMYSY